MDPNLNKNTQEVGYVTSSRDFLVFLDGMPTVKINDLVISETGKRGWVNSLHKTQVEVLMLDEGAVNPGELFKRSDSRLSISMGEYLLGRAVNPLGVSIDGKRLLATGKDIKSELDRKAPNINMRKFITEQFVTGITLIDTLIPIGKGQRELVLGDAHAGKTAFTVDLILNQRERNVVCIYASIGKPISQLKSLLEVLKDTGAMAYTVVIAASSSEAAPLIYLTPQTAFTVSEYFQKSGRDVLLILDDIGSHAKIYREISLLSGKTPGRESYPGDIFYQHSHLLERAGNFKDENGGGSITALPVLEVNLADFATYLPTNLVGMTDGHLLFNSNFRNQGKSPAIDVSLSVTRVGRQTQKRLQNLLSSRIRELMARAAELQTISKFSSELPFQTRLTLKQKEIFEELLNQENSTRINLELQIVLLSLTFTPLFLEKDAEFIKKSKAVILDIFTKDETLKAFLEKLAEIETLDEFLKQLTALIPVINNYLVVGTQNSKLKSQK
ncbi:F0F1 ATP synthase subunit alpha [Candidatus Daviesbacteria bacterium]|nr:F0F1 ATP synthase subunit alpha [Candidatus Daviesbacteria bacterium]